MARSGSVPLSPPDPQILDPKVEDLRFHSFQISRQYLGGPEAPVNTFNWEFYKFLKIFLKYLFAIKSARQAPQVAK